jgi:glycosyltransferase involved in cell wall biosynthesis
MNIGRVLDDLHQTMLQHPEISFEVVVVDDKSTDQTGKVAQARGARVIRNPGPSGKGCALALGFENAVAPILLMMDADYSHRAEDVPRFYEALRQQEDVGLVIGSRIIGGSDEYTPIRALGNVMFTYAVGLFLGRFLSDALNGFKAFRREIFDDFVYTSRKFEIEIELLANALRKGYRVIEISSHERARAGGEAKSRVIPHGTLFLVQVLTEWLRNKGALASRAKPRTADSTAASEPSRTPPST